MSEVSEYINEIKKNKALSKIENDILARRYRNGDMDAKNKLIDGNLLLVVSTVSKYSTRLKHMSFMDLIQEGNLGLMRAIESYNPDDGAFSTYATYWIEQAALRSMDNKNNEIREPVYFQNIVYKYNELLRKCNEDKIEMPDDSELCKMYKIGLDTLKRVKDSAKYNTTSLNKIIGDDDDELEDIVPDTKNTYESVIEKMDNQVLFLILKENLPSHLYYILYYRLIRGENETLEAIANKFKLTRERIRQLGNKALNKIKPFFDENSKQYAEVRRKIENKYGRDLYRRSIEPIEPIDAVKYLYIKDELNDLEKDYFYLKVVLRENYTKEEYMNILHIDEIEYLELNKNIKLKINNKFKDKDKFKNFYLIIMKTYGVRIYDELNKKIDSIDYDNLLNICDNYDYNDLINDFDIENNLNNKDIELLRKFYSKPEITHYFSTSEVEKELNMLLYDYKNEVTRISVSKLKKAYLDNKDEFNDEQKLYIECYIIKSKDKKIYRELYKDSKISHEYIVDRLEAMYYKINNMNYNNFNKNKYVSVRNKLSKDRIELLDMFYGIGIKEMSITEIAEATNQTVIKTHDLIRDARNYAINLYTNRSLRIDIDKELYKPFVLNNLYEFTEETRNILKLYLIDNLDYSEISKITGLNKTRISNIVTEGVRKIDYYRFGISKVFIVSESEIYNYFYNRELNDDIKNIILLRFKNNKGIKEISKIKRVSIDTINKTINEFIKDYKEFLISKTILDDEEIKTEINKHERESIISEEDKIFISIYYGFTNKYNLEGIKLTPTNIARKYNTTKNLVSGRIIRGINSIKEKKNGLLYVDNLYIDRNKLDELLNDIALPISDKEREIICYTLELKDYCYKDFKELSSIYGDTPASIKRRYQRAIISINKYINKEIEPSINYEVVKKYLKYFSSSDKNYLIEFYKNNLTYDDISKKYSLTSNQVVGLFDRLKVSIYEMINESDAKKFDFDYYDTVKNENIPFIGNKELAIKAFELYYGHNHNRRYTIVEIKNILNLKFNESAISRLITFLMISICKYKDGIKNNNEFTYEEVKKYYESNNLPNYIKVHFENYIDRINKSSEIRGMYTRPSSVVINELIKYKHKGVNLKNTSREQILSILKKYKIKKNIKNYLMYKYDICERELMSGSDKNHVYRILNKLTKTKENNKLRKELL